VITIHTSAVAGFTEAFGKLIARLLKQFIYNLFLADVSYFTM